MFLYGEKETKDFLQKQKKLQKMKLPYYIQVHGLLKYNGEVISMWYKECEDPCILLLLLLISFIYK